MEDASCQASDPTGTDAPCNGQEIDIAEILRSDFKHVNALTCRFMQTTTPTMTDVMLLLQTRARTFTSISYTGPPAHSSSRLTEQLPTQLQGNMFPHAPMYLRIDNFVGKFGGIVDKDIRTGFY
jgi:hypothetical protein